MVRFEAVEDPLEDLERALKFATAQIEPMWQATAYAAAKSAETFYRQVVLSPFTPEQAFELTLAFLGKMSSSNSGK